MKIYCLKFLAIVELLLVSGINAYASPIDPIFYKGSAAGHITSTYSDPRFVESWPSVGDKVLFDFTVVCYPDAIADACDWPNTLLTTSITVPAFSAVSYDTSSSYDDPEVDFDPASLEISYINAFDSAIPGDWIRLREGVEYAWWQEILRMQGTVGGEWRGEVYYDYTVYENGFSDQIEGGFSFAVQPVPEPATLFLFGSGLFGLAWPGMRKGSKKNE